MCNLKIYLISSHLFVLAKRTPSTVNFVKQWVYFLKLSLWNIEQSWRNRYQKNSRFVSIRFIHSNRLVYLITLASWFLLHWNKSRLGYPLLIDDGVLGRLQMKMLKLKFLVLYGAGVPPWFMLQNKLGIETTRRRKDDETRSS